MALKGIGVNNDLYVVQTYYDPESYTTPESSVGDYVVADFVATDYAQGPQNIPASAFTLSCEADVINVRAFLTSSFNVSVQGDKFDFASATLSTTSSIDTLAGFQLDGEAGIAVSASTSTNANQTHTTSKTISATATLGGDGNVSYKSSSSFDTVFTNISVGGIIFNAFQEGRQDDYTWDDFSEDSTIDRTWNEWFGGQWHPGMIIFSKGFAVSVLGGLINSGTGSYTASFTKSINANKTTGFAQPKDLSTQSSIASDYIRIRNVSGGFATAFSVPNKIGSATFRGSGSYNTAYSFTVNANATFGPTKTITGAFAPSVNANVAYDIIKLLAPTATLQSNANVVYGPLQLEIEAFNTVLSAGRLITIADPWNILTVPVETKTFFVPVETRLINVLQETRVNTTTTETRKLQVPQETRKFTIFKPQFTNRSSIPKVRQEA